MLSFEKLCRRRLFAALIQSSYLLAPSSEAISIFRDSDSLQLGLRFQSGQDSILTLSGEELEESGSIKLELPDDAVDAVIRDIDSNRVLAEVSTTSGVNVVEWQGDQTALTRREEASYLDSAGSVLLSDELASSVVSNHTSQASVDSLFFAIGLDEEAKYLFGSNISPSAIAIDYNSGSLSLGAEIPAQRPPELEESHEFFGDYLASMHSAELNPSNIGVFEYLSVQNNTASLELGLSELSTGAFLGSAGQSYGLDVLAENGVIAIATPSDVELFVQSAHIASLLDVSPNSRLSLETMIADEAVGKILGIVDIETDGYSRLELLLEIQHSSTSEIQNYVFSIIDPAPLSNPLLRYDVNADGIVSPLDALLVINVLNRHPGSETGFRYDVGPPFYDVNADQFITALDALLVINQLNRVSLGVAEAEQVEDEDFALFDIYLDIDEQWRKRQASVSWYLVA